MEADRETWTFATGTAQVDISQDAVRVVDTTGFIPRAQLTERGRATGRARLTVVHRPGDGLEEVVAGATLVATNMALDVRGVPEPTGIRLIGMTPDRFAAFLASGVDQFAGELLASGAQPTRAAAVTESRRQHDELFPKGLSSPGQLLWSVLAQEGEDEVGMLWIAIQPDQAFIYDIEMNENARGQGFGTQVLRAAAAQTRAHDRHTLALNVFGHNTGARRLYEREGYAVTREVYSVPL